jgi:hypothetical protein
MNDSDMIAIMFLYRVIHHSNEYPLSCVNLSNARELAWYSNISINDLKPVWKESQELSFVLPNDTCHSSVNRIYYFILPTLIPDTPQYYHTNDKTTSQWEECDHYAVPLINGFITNFKKELSSAL